MRVAARRWLAVLLTGVAVATPAAGSVSLTVHFESPTTFSDPGVGIPLDDPGIRIVLGAPSTIVVTSGLLGTTMLDVSTLLYFSGEITSAQPAPVLELLALASAAGAGGLGVESIPEPGTLLLLAAGLAALHWIRPRR